MIEIIPTNTCPPDFAELTRRSEAFIAYSNQIHLDIDDAVFAPVLSWPYQEGQWHELEKRLPFADSARYEAHLMVEDPLSIGTLLANAGCARILSHIEVYKNTHAVKDAFAAYRIAGATEVGLAMLLDTPLSVLEPVIDECQAVLLMSIAKLGAQGAPFEERIYDRIRELHALYPNLTIAVDGGVGLSNIRKLVEAGATRFGVGSAIVKAPNQAEAYQQLLSVARGL